MTEPQSLLEIYDVTDDDAQRKIVRTLGRKGYLDAEPASDDKKSLVVVNSSRPSRAHWVFNKVRSIDDGAVLVHVACDDAI